jgi:N-acetyl-gamma-glutamyl-phosphate reductase
MINVSVVGVTGYTGSELVRLFLTHPHVRLASLTTRQEDVPALSSLVPSLPKSSTIQVEKFNADKVIRQSDAVFLCLPHTAAIELAEPFLKAGKVVIDLSADFRFKDAKLYDQWFHVKHAKPALLKKAVYALPEWNRAEIKKADLIANPGCYVTSVLLATLPLVKNKLIEADSIIADCKSGVSGAGRKLAESTHFCEAGENFSAYKVNHHQHMPEIEQLLSEAAGKKVVITFVPHLLPVKRGILSTLYLERKKGVSVSQIVDCFTQAYAKEPFVRVLPLGKTPQLKDVVYTNFCNLGIVADENISRVIVISAIDNLLKGASGQAIQNFNIRFGFPETAGLA